MIAAAIFLLGLVIGSFLNVCILRIPARGIRGAAAVALSCLQGADQALRQYSRGLSWLLLGGRCRKCKAPISPMYPLVELLTGLLFLACYLWFGPTVEFAKWAVFAALLVVLTITDIRERILPDKVNFLGLGLGLAFSLLHRAG